MAMIDGKKISAETREQIALDAQKLMAETGIRPGLAVVIVGDDPASHVYVKNKKKGCEQVGFPGGTDAAFGPAECGSQDPRHPCSASAAPSSG